MTYAPAIEALERELAAVEARAASLRDAIAVLRRHRELFAENANQDAAPASEPVEKISMAPADGLYGEHGAADDDDLTPGDRAVLAAIRALGPRAPSGLIAARAGVAPTSVKRHQASLQAAGLLRIEGHARGRRLILMGGSLAAAPMSAPAPQKPAVERPKAAPAMSTPAVPPALPRKSPTTPAPQPAAAPPAAPRESVPASARPAVPYVPPKGDDARAQEQAEIERFLAEKGARRFDDRAGLLGMLEAAFAEDGIKIEEAFDVQARRQRKPYRLAGKLVTAEHAIRHADIIRKRMGLPPIAAEVTEAAE